MVLIKLPLYSSPNTHNGFSIFGQVFFVYRFKISKHCRYYQQGKCTKDPCPYLHTGRVAFTDSHPVENNATPTLVDEEERCAITYLANKYGMKPSQVQSAITASVKYLKVRETASTPVEGNLKCTVFGKVADFSLKVMFHVSVSHISIMPYTNQRDPAHNFHHHRTVVTALVPETADADREINTRLNSSTISTLR